MNLCFNERVKHAHTHTQWRQHQSHCLTARRLINYITHHIFVWFSGLNTTIQYIEKVTRKWNKDEREKKNTQQNKTEHDNRTRKPKEYYNIYKYNLSWCAEIMSLTTLKCMLFCLYLFHISISALCVSLFLSYSYHYVCLCAHNFDRTFLLLSTTHSHFGSTHYTQALGSHTHKYRTSS